jgi:hypothetical protein
MRAGDPLPQLSTKGGEKEVSYYNDHSSIDFRLLDACPTLALRGAPVFDGDLVDTDCNYCKIH